MEDALKDLKDSMARKEAERKAQEEKEKQAAAAAAAKKAEEEEKARKEAEEQARKEKAAAAAEQGVDGGAPAQRLRAAHLHSADLLLPGVRRDQRHCAECDARRAVVHAV